MTPLRFRVWDKNNDCFYEPTYAAYKGDLEDLLLSPSGNLIMRTMRGVTHESQFPNRFVVMQSTGLHDKNGKEIFESDIVSFQNKHMENPEMMGIVKWDKGRLCWTVEKSRDGRMMGLPLFQAMDNGVCDEGLLIVDGNLYENPDLLPSEA